MKVTTLYTFYVVSRTKIGQFSFPVKRDQCWKWVQACGRGPEFRPTPHSRVCEIHFAEDDFKPDEGRKRRRLKNGKNNKMAAHTRLINAVLPRIYVFTHALCEVKP